MLRNRSRAVSGKQALMADNQISRFSSYSYTKPLENSLFGSPKYKAFSPTKKGIDDHNSVISPTSVLDSNNKPFFSLQNPFIKLQNPNTIAKTTTALSPEIISGPKKPIGLALIEDKNDDSKPTKSVIFSAKLRVQIPPPDSAMDGGCIRNNNDNIGSLMTVKEMEVCEEYTCVKRHGPNAKITHIFDNFVVKTLVDDYYHYGSSRDFSSADWRKKKKKMNNNNNNDFLRFCYTCKNDLQLTNDIYIYRGEKAFCSHECRNREMLLDEEDEDSS